MSRLARRLDELDRLRSGCIARATALSPEALVFRPAPDQWCVAQVLHHLCRVEEVLLQAFHEPLPPESGVPTPRERLGRLIVKGIFAFGFRVRMPTQRVAPDEAPSLPETVRRWEEAGRQVRETLAGVLDPGKPVMRHPVAGPLDAEGAASFLVDHLRHHLRQLERIRSAPGFPSVSAPAPS